MHSQPQRGCLWLGHGATTQSVGARNDRPYQEAYTLGKVHQQLLTELASEVGSVERLTQEYADRALSKYAL
ncbi:hypothetical protein [Endozoicomonas sp.]|uniref:hypothetical protein n=1 Tax=Endozoicomonas sp. TaxID=1892382 RepID=UPI00383B4A43